MVFLGAVLELVPGVVTFFSSTRGIFLFGSLDLVSLSGASTSVTLLGGVAVGVVLLLESDLEGTLLLGLWHDLLRRCLRSSGLLDLDLLDLLLGSWWGLQERGSLYIEKDRWVFVIARVTS